MSYPINYPTPQGANVQIFRGGNTFQTSHTFQRDWVKPQGASFVWFTLIGAGGGGGAAYRDTAQPLTTYGGGGASGNITNFMCPAFLLPDVLQVLVGAGGNYGAYAGDDMTGSQGTDGEPTRIYYQQKTGTGYQILVAAGGAGGSASSGSGGSGGNGQAADTGGPMTAAGFYNATGGQNGATPLAGGASINVITTSGTTFVMGGNAGYDLTNLVTGYYGYTATERSGYSQLSPIPLAISNGLNGNGPQSFGCGGVGGGNGATGTATSGGQGGDGLAIIVTW